MELKFYFGFQFGLMFGIGYDKSMGVLYIAFGPVSVAVEKA